MIIKILKKIFCKHTISFIDKRTAEKWAKELTKNNQWQEFSVKRCKFCRKYYAERKYSKETNVERIGL